MNNKTLNGGAQAAIVQLQKKEEAKFICSACGADRGCDCNAPAIEKLAQKQEQDRQRAKAYRERKAEENQQPRHVTEKPPKPGSVEYERDRQACIALDQKARVAERELAQWHADHPGEADASASAEDCRYYREEPAIEPATVEVIHVHPNPVIAAFHAASKDQQREFWTFVKDRNKSVLLLEQLHRITNADEALDLTKVGTFLERLGEEMFSKALTWAPKLKAEIERSGRNRYKPLKDASNTLRRGLGTRSPAAHELAIANINTELERKGITRDDIVIALSSAPLPISDPIPDRPAAKPASSLIKANGASVNHRAVRE
jgi:hypothetical protein